MIFMNEFTSRSIQSSDTIIVKSNYNQMTIFDWIHMNNCAGVYMALFRVHLFTLINAY